MKSLIYYLLIYLFYIQVTRCKNLSVSTLIPLAVVTLDDSSQKPSQEQFNHVSELEDFRCKNDSDCPPWAVCGNQSVCKCSHNLPDKVDCSDITLQLSVVKSHCVTYDNNTDVLHVGLCIENSVNGYKDMYLPLPTNTFEMNQKMCGGHWNREGQLCGKCKPGHAPLVYSYELKCVSCDKGQKNYWIFLLIALGPSTIFFLIVLFFKINTTSSHLHGYLLFSQAVSMPSFVRVAWLAERDSRIRMTILKIFMLFCSIWNLDILKGVYPNICLDVSTLTVLSLEYIVALYPLALVVLSYILITLHARNYRIVVFAWRPFRYLFTFFRRNWDIRSTVIDTYTSFFQLSFLKIVGISCDLLIPIPDYKTNRNGYTKSLVLYYDGSVKFLSHEHLPHAILAFILLLVFCILPTLLLLLYPFRWFQVVLSSLRLRSQMLQAVMDSFQGYYKDGTEEGTRDCRWFSAVPLLVCYTFMILNNCTQDGTFYPVGSAITAVVVILIVFIQPYKRIYSNYQKVEIIFWGFIACFYSLIAASNFATAQKSTNTITITKVLLYVTGMIPLVYISCVTVYWIATRARLLRRCKQYFAGRILRGSYQEIGTEREDTLPDRISNPTAYENNPRLTVKGLKSAKITGQDLQPY